MTRITVIGGGIIGLFCAYYLKKTGHTVRLIEARDQYEGASSINAGLFCPSHFIALAEPSMKNKSFQWIIRPSSPLYVQPRLDLNFIRWGWQFFNNANADHVAKSIQPLLNITLLGKNLFEKFLEEENINEHLYSSKGLLMMYSDEKNGNKERKTGDKARNLGLNVEDLDRHKLLELEPSISSIVKGAVHYKCDSHSTPAKIMDALKYKIRDLGVELHYGMKVTGFEKINHQINIIHSEQQDFKTDIAILACGAWSPILAKSLGIPMLIEAGKGYSVDVSTPRKIKYPSILIEPKTAITPMESFLRISGKMELMGLNARIRKNSIITLTNALKAFYRDIEVTKENLINISSGYRPLSVDGLPLIGRSSAISNLFIATGHGMLGWTMAAATGKIITELIQESNTSIPVDAFRPERSF
ncbi:MAG TPA: FAD-dependent oxidoreductase [Saprospiraceae bacterium]|nr:FAD-dependent oxidoreductase [Saprospiraceae bacterium]